MTTQIKIGSKVITESIIDGNDVIYIVKFQGERQPFYTLLTAKEDATQSDLDRKLFLKDCNKGSTAFWANRVDGCEFKSTAIPSFSQCLNEYGGGYGRLIIEEFKF